MTDRCGHLTVDDITGGRARPDGRPIDPARSQITRRCLLCGVSYDRSAVLLQLWSAIRARHRLPPSPWSAQERAEDPWS